MNCLHTVARDAPQKTTLGPNPLHVIKSRPRTDEDKAWYADQLKVEIRNLYHREVYRQMAYYGSCKPARLCFAAHSTIAKEKGISVKSVQRAVKHLEHEGLIRRLSVGSGRETGKYQILGRSKSPYRVPQESMQGGLGVHQIEEGIEKRIQKPFSSRCEAQFRGAKPTSPTKELEPTKSLEGFPSPAPGQEKASAPVAEEIKFQHPGQVAKLFKLQRKLGYTADDKQAEVFDGLEHVDKARILNQLEAEEQQAALRGEVSAPPPKALTPRHLPSVPTAPPASSSRANTTPGASSHGVG